MACVRTWPSLWHYPRGSSKRQPALAVATYRTRLAPTNKPPNLYTKQPPGGLEPTSVPGTRTPFSGWRRTGRKCENGLAQVAPTVPSAKESAFGCRKLDNLSPNRCIMYICAVRVELLPSVPCLHAAHIIPEPQRAFKCRAASFQSQPGPAAQHPSHPQTWCSRQSPAAACSGQPRTRSTCPAPPSSPQRPAGRAPSRRG